MASSKHKRGEQHEYMLERLPIELILCPAYVVLILNKLGKAL